MREVTTTLVRPAPRSTNSIVVSPDSIIGCSVICSPKDRRPGGSTTPKCPSLGYSSPSGPTIVMRHTPPGLRSKSIFSRGVVKCSGPHHFVTSSGSVHTCQTSSRGASSSRSITIVCSLIVCCPSAIVVCLSLDLHQMCREPIEPSFPDPPVLLEPFGHRAQRCALEPRRSQLRRPSAGDQAGPLEHLEVLGDGLQAEREGLGKLVHGDHALLGEPRDDRTARGVGQGRERDAQLVGRDRTHPPSLSTNWLRNRPISRVAAMERLTVGAGTTLSVIAH